VLDADDVRRIALSFPETVEKQRWGHPTFDVAGRMFITVPDDQTSFAVRCPRLEREEQILAAVARGRARIPDMVSEIYADVDARLHPAAAHSVLAHLIKLVREGRVVSDGPAGPAAAYAPPG